MKVIRKIKKHSLNEAVETNQLPELTAANIKALFNSPEFKTPVSDEEVKQCLEATNNPEITEDFDNLDEASINNCIQNFLTETYSNVKAFEMTGQAVKNGYLFIEGNVTFADNRTKKTNFEFKPGVDNKLKGRNPCIAESLNLELSCKKTDNKIIAEELKYSLNVGNSLVEGLSKYVR